MAESSTSHSNSSELITAKATSIPPSLKFVMTNLKSIVSTTLSAENYPLWSSQVFKLFKANGFDGFLTSSLPCPPQFLQSDTGINLPDPRYSQWLLFDQNLSAALTATISIYVLPYVLNLSSTAEIWQTLLKRLQATNRSRVLQPKIELNQVSLKNNSVTHFLSEVKSLVDQISAAGSHVDTEDVILHILNGLQPSYQAFKTAIRTRAGPLDLDELYSLLISEEINLANEVNKDLQLTQQALYTPSSRGRGRGYFSRGRGRQSASHRFSNPNHHPPLTYPSRQLPCCQICHKNGHTATDCWHRTNLDFSPSSKPPPQALLAHNNLPNSEWVLDSGATSHLTSDLNNLQSAEPYRDMDVVSTSNGSTLPIANAGIGLPTPTRKLSLSPL